MRNVFVLDMDCNDDWVINVFNCPTEGIATVLVFLYSHHGDI